METTTKLELRSLSKSYGSVLAVDSVDLKLQAGQMLALLGPSGCGKTTTLRTVAGLERPSSGEVILDGQVLADGRQSVPPEHRGLGMVFQTYALWPHMTVFENVAYGLRALRMPEPEIRSRVGEVLAMAGMSGYEERPATNLSGGQQQRVAVARAIATRPRILLFDEPLSNLDALLRESMRMEIRSLQKASGITAIYVTHSQDEALAMADVVGVMKDGRLQQLDSPQALYARPRNRFVAGFVGLANVIAATIESVSGSNLKFVLPDGSRGASELDSATRERGYAAGKPISLAVRPERIHIERAASAPASPDGHLRLSGTVASIIFTGNLIDYFVNVHGLPEPVRVQSLSPARADMGDEVALSIAPENCVALED